MNYTEQLNKVMGLFKYRGLLVERQIGGFKLHDKRFLTMEDLDKYLDERFSDMGDSIVGKNISNGK